MTPFGPIFDDYNLAVQHGIAKLAYDESGGRAFISADVYLPDHVLFTEKEYNQEKAELILAYVLEKGFPKGTAIQSLQISEPMHVRKGRCVTAVKVKWMTVDHAEIREAPEILKRIMEQKA